MIYDLWYDFMLILIPRVKEESTVLYLMQTSSVLET